MPNPKLEYDARTPAFLQRLKGQFGGPGQRQDVQFARPKKQLIDPEDDEPTYIDEDSHETISKEAYEKLTKGENEVASEAKLTASDAPINRPIEKDETTPRDDSSNRPEPKATIGSSMKRKIVRVVGSDEVETGEPRDQEVAVSAQGASKAGKPQGKSGSSKKGKRIKLSFDDDRT